MINLSKKEAHKSILCCQNTNNQSRKTCKKLITWAEEVAQQL